ncbi:MAG: hypothetical protein V1777_04590 [Candidatus Micrarchaeota archaeon]
MKEKKPKSGFAKKFSKKLNRKGFIGPIGDDLPSLIPLTFALVIFFGAFAFAFNAFDQKKIDFDQKFALLRIGQTLKGDNLIENYEKWNALCHNVEVRNFKYRAVVFKIPVNTGQYQDYQFFKEQQGHDPCNNSNLGTNCQPPLFDYGSPSKPQVLICQNNSDELTQKNAPSYNLLRINFPVAINDNGVIRPALLAVAVWR